MDMSRNDETYYSTSELTVLLYLNIHVVFTGYLSLYIVHCISELKISFQMSGVLMTSECTVVCL
jgi:hypothetical protein